MHYARAHGVDNDEAGDEGRQSLHIHRARTSYLHLCYLAWVGLGLGLALGEFHEGRARPNPLRLPSGQAPLSGTRVLGRAGFARGIYGDPVLYENSPREGAAPPTTPSEIGEGSLAQHDSCAEVGTPAGRLDLEDLEASRGQL